MSEYKFLLTEKTDQILTVTINRPEKLNALNQQVLKELQDVFENIDDDDDIRGVILTGAGEKAFVAGADIEEIAALNEVNARKIAENGQEVFKQIENCDKPVIAVINGYALGGGCELAMACHMRIAAESARFGQPEINLGIIPGYGGTQRLSLFIGKGKAIELMTTGEMLSAGEAQELGLVNHVVTASETMAKAHQILAKIKKKPAIQVGLIIDCVNAAFRKSENGYLTEANSFSACVKLEDFKEGTKAFIEKRDPDFKGK